MKIGSMKTVRWKLIIRNSLIFTLGYIIGMIVMFFIANRILIENGLRLSFF